MGSRKEEERNEKIIRGLMKLPPNRRCINCNSLGPQYVCTNFWTFICMTCSGIHREFTHRVKSVSMSKFTSQEVEALQNGGNQRAREIYLREWDQQRQRLPDNSNVDKVREFIKTVYVDKRYAGGKTHDKPPRDLQRMRSHEDETRRASSYHSYSQSPPYDFQYEDRLYGKQAATLTRKPGSDRGIYVGKMSSFICSPTRLNERMFEDRFANEGSVSRVSDYSMSSGGDLVSAESPNFQKDIGYTSPPIQTPRNTFGEDAQHQRIDLFSEANFKKEAQGIPHPQRTASLGSTGSFDRKSISIKPYNSGSLPDIVSEPEQPVGSTFPQQPVSGSYGNVDHCKAPIDQESNASAASPIDLFQMPATSPVSSINLFQEPPVNPAPSTTQTSLPASLDLFDGIAQQRPVASLDQNSVESSAPKNEGWATFDIQLTASAPGTGSLMPSVIPSSVGSSAMFDQLSSLSSLDTSMQWPPFQNSSSQGSPSVSDLWNKGLHDVQAPGNTGSSQMWNAFENYIPHIPLEGSNQGSQSQVAAHLPSTADQYMGLKAPEDSSKDRIERAGPYGGPSVLNGPSDIVLGASYTPPMCPIMEASQSHATNHKSINPFDLPYDSNMDPGNMFLDMSSLQAALPNNHMPSTFLGGVAEPWFPQDPVTTYIPAAPQGGLAYMAGQTPSPQLANIQTQGPVASVGGNPFA
ncbi:hypothetical protein JCGZ_02645 [Jatropha curcas]|uniref:Arf-GAP domain-containing protein n=1 Tax=Jatropha curcas TaxID=180498 RepID=A0A067L550_JATCU|nr:probable ADP-ribosylation factor GTPase-activating protein AGD14 isoform X2 [Jatropha curcas]KDP39625.1 hypothetical protein JCGZ_02645 [Jatropha curcas]